jgi:hypothetical protein
MRKGIEAKFTGKGIIEIKFSEDDQGPFLSYCNYSPHKGLIINHNRAKRCRKRRCIYYEKYRPEAENGSNSI